MSLQPSYPQTPPAKSNKKPWIILGIAIGIPTLLMGGCVACVALLGLSGAGSLNPANSNSRPASSTSFSSSQPATPSRPEIDGMPVYKTGEVVNVGYMLYKVYGAWYTNTLIG